VLLQAVATWTLVGPGSLTPVNDSQVRYTAPAQASGQALVIGRLPNGRADTSVGRFASGGGTVAGIPYGHYGMWSADQIVSGAPFTLGMGTTAPQNIVALLANLRARRIKAFINLFGGGATEYLGADGKFDLARWTAKLAEYDTPVIRAAIFTAWQEGTLLGFPVLDEPHNPKWNGGLTGKAMVDGMCATVAGQYPGIPTGVTHQPDLFHPSQSYTVCDFLINQYVWRKPAEDPGNVALFLEQAKTYSARDGIAMVFSLNILNGSFQAPRDGLWNCPTTTAGRGTDEPNCRMTATQIRDWGLTLGPHGCAMLMWTYNDAFMAKADNQSAFADIAAALAPLPPKACVRS
jgi:hypothetical protein